MFRSETLENYSGIDEDVKLYQSLRAVFTVHEQVSRGGNFEDTLEILGLSIADYLYCVDTCSSYGLAGFNQHQEKSKFKHFTC